LTRDPPPPENSGGICPRAQWENAMLMIMVIAGGMMAVYINSIILEWAIIKRVMNVRTYGVIASCAAATVIGLLSFGLTSEGWDQPGIMIAFTVGGVLCTIVRLLAGRGTERWRAERGEADKLKNTFE
jgi:hypothetical protein